MIAVRITYIKNHTAGGPMAATSNVSLGTYIRVRKRLLSSTLRVIQYAADDRRRQSSIPTSRKRTYGMLPDATPKRPPKMTVRVATSSVGRSGIQRRPSHV